MVTADLPRDERHPSNASDPDWLDAELVGLDRDDPEVQAFAAHLRRMHDVRPAFTVEGYLAGVSRFADSANRADGSRRLGAVLVVGLLLVVVGYLAWDVLHFVVTTLL
jgi:hypothetical protein